VFDDDVRAGYRHVEVPAATEDEIAQTVAVMGGADWTRWVDGLTDRGLLGPEFATVALSYIGSELTAAIYREGTIGVAKQDLERTAHTLDGRLAGRGRAATSVNGAAVTQSSTAIPGIGLYIGLLRRVLGDAMRAPVDQLCDLWDQLTGVTPPVTDDQRRFRLDSWELDASVQRAVAERWARADDDTIADLADLDWFRGEVHRLYGWGVAGVDYDAPTQDDVAWPQPD
jgi:enoyl-[acyl-carrier protein] reductase/trans-2-enoyl-CoA reductase (NAD+)